MSNLFEKAAMFTDIHFGLKNNSTQHLTDCENFVDWFIQLSKDHGCETCLFLGDWHHHRASINLQTLNYSIRSLEKLNDAFKKVYFIPGNHDLYYRDKRDVHGIEWAKHLPNIHLVNDWFTQDHVTIVPWMVGDDHKKLKKIKSKYVFGHFELPHFKMNQMVEMPDHGDIDTNDLQVADGVFSGHFHMRQSRGNIHYIGNAFPHNFADNGDSARGACILEWGEQPEFYDWDECPTYKVVKLSELLDRADDILRPNMYVRVNLDINISYEEANFIKETFIESHKLREISLLPDSENKNLDGDVVEAPVFHSVDQIITEQLTNIESQSYNKQLLLKIYQDL